MGAGAFRTTPDTDKHTSMNEGINLTYGVSHMCGWRRYMQDAHLAVSPLSDGLNSLFAIFDGHGGTEVAIFVSKHFISQLQLNLNYIKGDYQAALRETFLKMDQLMNESQGKRQIKEIQKQQYSIGNSPFPSQSVAGCTANVWLITPDYIYIANAGDSRGVLSINKKCQQTSIDHKPNDQLQFDRITKAGGKVTMGRVNGNLNLSRALGDFQFKQNSGLPPQQQMITANPDVKKIRNQNVDFAVIGCDGIWQEKNCQEMIAFLSNRIDRKPLGQILQELFDELIAQERTLDAHGTDNMSGILVKFNRDCNKKTNDQMGILMSKYLFLRENETPQKISPNILHNDYIVKLLRAHYFQ